VKRAKKSPKRRSIVEGYGGRLLGFAQIILRIGSLRSSSDRSSMTLLTSPACAQHSLA
jgi:hypothetical protein